MKHNSILIRYGEIGLKGGNRGYFENMLVKNMRNMLKANDIGFGSVIKTSGRLVVLTEDEKAVGVLRNVFGIVSLSPAVRVECDLDKIKRTALDSFNESLPDTFRISSQRLDKRVETTSTRMNEEVGGHIVSSSGCKVRLKNATLDIGIELTKEYSYIFTESIRGPGGLPTGVSGKVLCLFSGGIDSPVAAWLAMKRGCEVVMVHFLHGSKAPKKMTELVSQLEVFHTNIRLVLVPTQQIEKEIVCVIPARYRIIVLRRMFLQIAQKLMKKCKCKAIVTGDNIGQVASQTIDNMSVIHKVTNEMIILPLSCYDKQDIIDLAKKIGTYETSIIPYTDCCSFLLPKHPETSARLDEIRQFEANIDMSIVDDAVAKTTL